MASFMEDAGGTKYLSALWRNLRVAYRYGSKRDEPVSRGIYREGPLNKS